MYVAVQEAWLCNSGTLAIFSRMQLFARKVHVFRRTPTSTLHNSNPLTDPHKKMPKELEPSTCEKNFVLEALKENLRIDGRNFESFRELEISFGEDYGLADVQLGKTR